MDTKAIAALLIKLTGLVLVVVAVSQLPRYFPLTGRGFEFSIGEVVATTAIALGPLAALGLILWFFPGTVTNKVVSGAPVDSAPVDARPIELVALTILGVYLLADGLIEAVRDIAVVIIVSRQDASAAMIPASIIGHLAATIAQLVIGAGLCIGARGVSRVIARLRE